LSKTTKTAHSPQISKRTQPLKPRLKKSAAANETIEPTITDHVERCG